MGPLLLWGLVLSGGAAAYFYKKSNPGKSLNPTPHARPAGTGTVVTSRDLGSGRRVVSYSDGTSLIVTPSLEFYATSTKPPVFIRAMRGSQEEAEELLRSLG